MILEAGDVMRAPRVPMELRVQYRFEAGEDFRSGQGANLSTSGVFLHTGERRPVGTMVTLRISRPDGSAVVEGFGRVARLGEAPPEGMGVQFIHLDDRSMKLVEEMVAGELAGGRGSAEG